MNKGLALVFIVVFVLGWLSGFLTAGSIFRTHLRNIALRFLEKEAMIAEQKEAIRKLIYQFNHYGMNPLAKRFRGLVNLTKRPFRLIREYLDLLNIDQTQVNYLALTKEINEIEELFLIGERVCLEAEEELNKTVKEFDHLQ